MSAGAKNRGGEPSDFFRVTVAKQRIYQEGVKRELSIPRFESTFQLNPGKRECFAALCRQGPGVAATCMQGT